MTFTRNAMMTGAAPVIPSVYTAGAVTTVAGGTFPRGIAFAPDSKKAYIANITSGNVTVFDCATNTNLTSITTGASPNYLAMAPNGQTLYACSSGSGTQTNNVYVISTSSNTQTATVTSSPLVGPRGMAVSPDNTKLYVSYFNSNAIGVVDTATNTVTTTIAIAGGPFGVVFSPDGSTAYTANFRSATVSVIDVATSTVTSTISTGGTAGAYGINISPDGKKLYLLCGNSLSWGVYDLTTSSYSSYSIPNGETPNVATLSADGKWYLVPVSESKLYVFNAATGAVARTITQPGAAYSVGMSPDQSKVIVPGSSSNNNWIMNGKTAVAVTGTNAGSGSSISIPTHAIGDLIVVFAYRDGSDTGPSKPAAGGTVPTWTDITAGTGANSNSSYVAYAVATATNHTTGTWTNATGMAVAVLRGQGATAIGGSAAEGTVLATSATAPGITQTDLQGASALLHFYGHRNVTDWGSAPTGYKRKSESVAGKVALNTKDDTTSDGAITQNISGSSGGYRGHTIEVLI